MVHHNALLQKISLRVVSNFDDGDCGAGEIHTRARTKFREDVTRGERQKLIFGAPLASRLLEISCARVCVFRPPHKRSPKLETTRSLTENIHTIPMKMFSLPLLLIGDTNNKFNDKKKL